MSELIYCLVPCRLGSQRVKNINLKKINNKPFINYVLGSISKSRGMFYKVHLNSENTI